MCHHTTVVGDEARPGKTKCYYCGHPEPDLDRERKFKELLSMPPPVMKPVRTQWGVAYVRADDDTWPEIELPSRLGYARSGNAGQA